MSSFLITQISLQVHALIEVVEGEPRYVLCNAAEKHHADLLVVGSHGYGAIKRFLACPRPWFQLCFVLRSWVFLC